MQIYSLDATNITPLSTNYNLDATVRFKKNTFYTENNIFLNLEKILQTTNDVAINNYSNLALTDTKILNDVLTIKPLEYLSDENFSTYLAADSLFTITDRSRYWVVEEPNNTKNTAAVAISGTTAEMDNRYYFEISLLDDFTCKIAHENDGIKRYLTADLNGTLTFCKEANLDYLGEHSPQIFLYNYDRANDVITFLKNLHDIIYSLTYNNALQELTYTPTITGTNLDFSAAAVFRCMPRRDTSNNTLIDDPWVSYQKNSNDNIAINTNLSYENIQSNILLNSQYITITGSELNANLLSLKNTNTPEDYQSRANPFFQEDSVLMRDYKKMFTGSNQELGNDNITLDYEAYTSSVILKKDKVTYFHIPENFYPFKALNINDSTLAEAGAIAGDHPLKSDKIFKKKANYKFTSFYGNTTLENNGTFLCSWLSGSPTFTTRPIWVDRYYFPSKTSFIGALSASTLNAVEYRSVYDCLRSTIPENINVIDKLSDSIFEPGGYYAYHHIGSKYSKDYIQYIQKYLVQQNFKTYLNTNKAAIPQDNLDPVYSFDGSSYCITNNLSTIQDSNEFTMILDIYSSDWTKPFGYQLLGNYSADGFGVFNTNKVTPTLYINSLSSINITNLNFKKIDTIQISASALAIIRLDGFNDSYIITSDGFFNKYNNQGNLIYRYYNDSFEQIYDYDYDDQHCYVLGKTPFVESARLFKVELLTGNIYEVTNSDDYAFYFSHDFNSDFYNNLRVARTVNFRNNAFYFTQGDKAERFLDDIFYKVSSPETFTNAIYKWNIKFNNTTSDSFSLVMSAYNSIDDFDLDIDGNLWTLYDYNKYVKINSNNVIQLSGTLPSSSISTNIDFGLNFVDDNLEQYAFISVLSSSNRNVTYKLDNTSGNLLSVYYATEPGSNNTSISQSSFLRYYYSDLYQGNNLNIKLKLKNIINSADFEMLESDYDLSTLSPGYHNFVFRFNSNAGTFYLIVDGQIIITNTFPSKKYKFSNLIERPFFFGVTCYSNTVPLFDYLDDNTFNCRGIKIKNFYLYNRALNYFDILFHNRIDQTVEDIVFDLPCSKRNYLEEIERFFKFRTPGSKSPIINIVLKNSGINNLSLRSEIEKRIYNILLKSAPAYTKVKSFKWSN